MNRQLIFYVLFINTLLFTPILSQTVYDIETCDGMFQGRTTALCASRFCCKNTDAIDVMEKVIEGCYPQEIDYETFVVGMNESFFRSFSNDSDFDLSGCIDILNEAFDVYCYLSMTCVGIPYTYEYECMRDLVQYITNKLQGESGWNCSVDAYMDGVCDCNCGIPDPDCDNNPIGSVEACNGEDPTNCAMKCINGSCVTRDLANWTCDSCYYEMQDGCDCGCGLEDPDCSDSTAYIHGCDNFTCGVACVQGECTKPDISVPEGWICPHCYYGTGDGCDCNCGIPDPDCELSNVSISCEIGQVCIEGTCQGDAMDWTCFEGYYNAGDSWCDCECGVWDPDCDQSSMNKVTRNCGTNEQCVKRTDGYSECRSISFQPDTSFLQDLYTELVEGYMWETYYDEENYLSYNSTSGYATLRFNSTIDISGVIDEIKMIINMMAGTRVKVQLRSSGSILEIQFLYTIKDEIPIDKISHNYTPEFFIPLYGLEVEYSEFNMNFPGVATVSEPTCQGNPASINIPNANPELYGSNGDTIFYHLQNINRIDIELQNGDCGGIFILIEHGDAIPVITVEKISGVNSSFMNISSTSYMLEKYSYRIGDYFVICCDDISASSNIVIHIPGGIPVKSIYIDTIKVFARWFPFASTYQTSPDGEYPSIAIQPMNHSRMFYWAYSHVKDKLPPNDLSHQLVQNLGFDYNRVTLLLTGKPENSNIYFENVLPIPEGGKLSVTTEKNYADTYECNYQKFKQISDYFNDITANDMASQSIISSALISLDDWQVCLRSAQNAYLDGLPEQCSQYADCLQTHMESIGTLTEVEELCEAYKSEQLEKSIPNPFEVPYTCLNNNCRSRLCAEEIWTCMASRWGDDITDHIFGQIGNTTDSPTFYDDFLRALGTDEKKTVYEWSINAKTSISLKIAQKNDPVRE
eukprot:TRINITY_DN6650_c0_g1_i1.p1 TRINITY_DN6650_c0_g1~~TRINITY_DN6650_c0_g1_i1.p1  ORF type:complete len:920 (+),score=147.08 TRINITY_DN6650_c0_g1_i1:2-2761(+)